MPSVALTAPMPSAGNPLPVAIAPNDSRITVFSITYLMALFGAFIADHYCGLIV